MSAPTHCVVTGYSNEEWLWVSDNETRWRRIGCKWSEAYTGGDTVHQCLTRKYSRHQFKRVVKNPFRDEVAT